MSTTLVLGNCIIVDVYDNDKVAGTLYKAKVDPLFAVRVVGSTQNGGINVRTEILDRNQGCSLQKNERWFSSIVEKKA